MKREYVAIRISNVSCFLEWRLLSLCLSDSVCYVYLCNVYHKEHSLSSLARFKCIVKSALSLLLQDFSISINREFHSPFERRGCSYLKILQSFRNTDYSLEIRLERKAFMWLANNFVRFQLSTLHKEIEQKSEITKGWGHLRVKIIWV